MKALNVVMFKKRDIFIILIIGFLVAYGVFAGKDEEEDSAPAQVEAEK